MPAARTVDQLRADAWQAFTDAIRAGRTVTPNTLAKAARLTDGGAHRFLTDWRADRLAAPVPGLPPSGRMPRSRRERTRPLTVRVLPLVGRWLRFHKTSPGGMAGPWGQHGATPAPGLG